MRRTHYEAAYARLVDKGTVIHALDITGLKWTEIDTAEDFAAANAMFGSPVTTVSRGQQRRWTKPAEHAAASDVAPDSNPSRAVLPATRCVPQPRFAIPASDRCILEGQTMAKGNSKRGNKEAKKPKQEKPKVSAPRIRIAGKPATSIAGKKVK